MDLNKFLFKDSKGKPSLTATAFIVGFVVVNLKLIFSGVEFENFKIALFSGGEYAAAVGALGAVYVLRRSTDKDNEEK
jgi:hypothetical protein